jgi:hypothetical protein
MSWKLGAAIEGDMLREPPHHIGVGQAEPELLVQAVRVGGVEQWITAEPCHGSAPAGRGHIGTESALLLHHARAFPR